MGNKIIINRASPLTTIQDMGRFGQLNNGISASGAMDRSAFIKAGELLKSGATSGIEFTAVGLDFTFYGDRIKAAFTGAEFSLFINEQQKNWHETYALNNKDRVEIKPAKNGNYGYVRFNQELDVPLVLNSRATNMIASLGGYKGRALKQADEIFLCPANNKYFAISQIEQKKPFDFIRFIWGIHAEKFSAKIRNNFISKRFTISSKLNRMGVRLIDENNIFKNAKILSLISDAIVVGDIQILGDGTPIVLMRDHQTIGGYPRIGTIISADIDRFSQLRPNSKVHFKPISVENVQKNRN